MIKSVCQAAGEVMRLVCGNSAHTTCVTQNCSQEGWVGHPSRKLAVRRNVGSARAEAAWTPREKAHREMGSADCCREKSSYRKKVAALLLLLVLQRYY